MAISDEQVAFALDLFAGVGPLTTRKMFGGLGIYADGQIFALVMSTGEIRLKAVGPMIDILKTEGWSQWTYERKNGAMSSMPYWQIPDDILDDPDAASAWARRAVSFL
ncbi:MAG: TfoX/Sxy family protein [Paracoccaceae bacterium]